MKKHFTLRRRERRSQVEVREIWTILLINILIYFILILTIKSKQHKWLKKSTGRTEEATDGNNSQDNTNDNLVRMLGKAQEKQLNNLTTKFTETAHSQKW